MCKIKPRQPEARPPQEQVEYVGTDDESTDSDSDQLAFDVRTVIKDSTSRIMLEPTVGGLHLLMELDTGASVSIVSQDIVKRLLPNVKVSSSRPTRENV